MCVLLALVLVGDKSEQVPKSIREAAILRIPMSIFLQRKSAVGQTYNRRGHDPAFLAHCKWHVLGIGYNKLVQMAARNIRFHTRSVRTLERQVRAFPSEVSTS